MPLQTFRYAACGGANTLLDIFLFNKFQHSFAKIGVIHVAYFAMKPHIAALIAAFFITFPVGFYLNRYVVFTESNVRGRIQLVRYFSLVMACMALNYMFIKFFVEQLHIEPTLSKVFTSVIVIAFSYLSQKHFTFKIKTIKHHSSSVRN